MFEIYKCGMAREKDNNNRFTNSCKHRFLGDCFKRLSCPCKLKNDVINIKCKETIEFADDFGDNSCTFHCQKNEEHSGNHTEKGIQYGKKYILKWND